MKYDVAIVGGGCVGCSVAYHLAREMAFDVCVIEKEHQLASHQSGRNSGVLHPGFNYPPGSLKARFATAGTKQMKEYCAANGVPIEELGVLVVATDSEERARLTELQEQATENGVETELLENEREIHEHEPHAAGEAALYCPEAASVDSQKYVHSLAGDAENAGVDFYTGAEVQAVKTNGNTHRISTSIGTISSTYLVNTAGLYADKLAHQMGVGHEYHVVPFRGEYYELVPEKRHLVNSMIYPTPDPELPFLGVHYTRRSDDKVIIGPNAVLAFGREAYKNTQFDITELLTTLGYSGFWRLFMSEKMIRVGLNELHKSYRKSAFVKAAKDLVPEVTDDDFQRSYAGIRAQIVRDDGQLIKEPLFEHGPQSTHVLNAVSPGLTSSLPFGAHLTDEIIANLDSV
ncbi:L-2-hydroxyglutarate oxidase [Halonotius aquaticus]|uniref:L-2-hydroxyglutarate oxidase n=1 Tax=Halonotius aquaticus TaxID=2216978 RepID=A0A3A6Q1Z5_9EURY|nr:L-2-hydroxyglutarate oxidase [Halonotius aquaticus]RJX44610.1 L-2-hydroxyglutarate oxidase [Halonotius aquaticus]